MKQFISWLDVELYENSHTGNKKTIYLEKAIRFKRAGNNFAVKEILLPAVALVNLTNGL